MKVKELPGSARLSDYKLKIPSTVTQLGNMVLEEGYFMSFHASGGGWFMSPDPPGDRRRLIPTYGDSGDILEWEIIDESKSS